MSFEVLIEKNLATIGTTSNVDEFADTLRIALATGRAFSFFIPTVFVSKDIAVLVSDAIKDAQECCLAYEERNQVEYAFNMLKARLECNRTMVHSTQAWDGKLFVQILAMAIAGMIRSRIKIYNETTKQNKKKYRVHYDSDHKLLAKLNNIYMTQFKAGWMFDEIVGKHRELFNILNVPVPTVEQVIADDSTDEDSDETDLSFDLENLPLDDEQEDL